MGKKIKWFFFVLFSIAIGLYPLTYFLIERTFGLLQWKTEELLTDTLWNIGFYTHIILGGIALLIGWTQFSKKLRKQNLNLHRLIGKIYVGCVSLSAIAGFYIGFYATGGTVASIGFIGLAIFWFYVTLKAYQLIKARDISGHQRMMILSYAACWGAVTLRLWLPILVLLFKGDFIPAYQVVAYLSWIPNVLFAYWYVEKNGIRISKT